MKDKERRFDLIAQALEIDSDNELIKTIIQNVANITIQDIQQNNSEFEIFAKPHSITGKELTSLQEIFKIREIGIYGDTEIPQEDVYLHMIVYVDMN